jgi:hypothetical protein
MKADLRNIFAAAVVLAATGEALAQQRASRPPPEPPRAARPAPQPPTLPPQAPAALTVPKPLPPPPGAAGVVDLYRRLDGYQTIYPQHQLPVFGYGGYGYGYGYGYGQGYGYGGYGPGAGYPIYSPAGTTANMRQWAPALGGLWLETQPGSAQVYVDGYYVGLADDYGATGRMLDLRVGTRRIELREAGYDPLTFDVNVALNQIIRYRGDLQRQRVDPPPTASNRSRAPTAVYLIPNCYAGNKPPTSALPGGCDPARMRVIERP